MRKSGGKKGGGEKGGRGRRGRRERRDARLLCVVTSGSGKGGAKGVVKV